MNPSKRHFEVAKSEGRICTQCEWMITKVDWEKGHRLCGNCRDANKGVNTNKGHAPYSDEPKDRTGDMP